MNFQSLLIVTYGRSGSTLLQGVLNSIDGSLIRGENSMMCLGLFNTYQSILEARKNEGREVTTPWYGSAELDPDLYLRNTKSLLRELLVPASRQNDIRCYGFKEVWYERVIDEFTAYLEFLKRIFPQVCFIFNTRQIHDVLVSGWWKRTDLDDSRQTLERLDSLFREYDERNDDTFLIDYKDVCCKSDRLREMFSFIGADFEEERIDQVLGKLHSFNPAQKHAFP